jgi:hypothetical protein
MTSFGPAKDHGPIAADLTFRRARASDALALFRLAALDSSRTPRGAVLLAVVGDEPWAAVSLDDLHLVSDPFRPAGDVVLLLLDRAREERRDLRRRERYRGGRRRFGLRRPAFA